jgi:hypothetical protein
MRDSLHLHLESATAAMEVEEWPGAIALLVSALAELDGRDEHLAEATTRMLLAQSLASAGSLPDALQQVADAQSAAERADDRDLIHRCMALAASLRVLQR